MGKRGQRGREGRSGAACGWRWADREVELVWGAADMQLGEWMERSRWGHEKRPIRNLFTDVNDSSWESEPPTVLWCLSQTFVCLLGGLEMRSCHISAHMKAVREILSLTPIFQNGSLQFFFPYENYFYQLFHQQVSANPPGTTHTTSTGLPQSEIYPFRLLLLTSWCLEEELGMVLCCSMHSPWHDSGGAALGDAPKTSLLFCRPLVAPVKLLIAESSFAAEWKEPEGSLVSFHHFLISS